MIIALCISLIPVILTTTVQAEVSGSDVTKSYLHDCATVEVDKSKISTHEYKLVLELVGQTKIEATNNSNSVKLCNIPMCQEVTLRFTMSSRAKSSDEFQQIYTEDILKTLDVPKITDVHTEAPLGSSVVLRWTLQNYNECRDKELVFFLFGDKTIMQLAKGQEIRIPYLTNGQKYSVYAFPNRVDKEVRVFTTPKFDLLAQY
ncbi:unnamed protein product [Trichobilharzia szidati]|nr:unnamed protein product [Trichobilharzia szidati]CAH8873543.1 unnamed protein product [Trichobilharzia szidati]